MKRRGDKTNACLWPMHTHGIVLIACHLH